MRSISIMKTEFFRNIFSSLFAGVFGYLVNFFMAPVVINKLGIEAYAFVSLGSNMLEVFSVLSLALNSFSARYIADGFFNNKKEEASGYYSSVFVGNCILSILIFFVFIIFAANLTTVVKVPQNLHKDVTLLFLFLTLNFIGMLFYEVYSTLLFINNQIYKINMIKSFMKVMYLLLILLSLWGKVFYLYSQAIAQLLSTILGVLICRVSSQKESRNVIISFRLFDFKKIKILMGKGIKTSINASGALLNSGCDLYISNQFLTTILMGYIALSRQLGDLLLFGIGCVSRVFQPKQLKCYSENRIQDLVDSFVEAMKLCGFIGNVYLGCFLICGHEMFEMWQPGSDLNTLFNLTYIVILGNVFVSVITPLYYISTLTTKMNKVCAVTLTCGIVNVISMLLLIRYPWGHYVVVLTTTFINIIALYLFPSITIEYLSLKENPFVGVICKHLTCACVLSLMYYVLNRMNVFNEMPLVSCAIYIVPVIVMVFFFYYKISDIKGYLKK